MLLDATWYYLCLDLAWLSSSVAPSRLVLEICNAFELVTRSWRLTNERSRNRTSRKEGRNGCLKMPTLPVPESSWVQVQLCENRRAKNHKSFKQYDKAFNSSSRKLSDQQKVKSKEQAIMFVGNRSHRSQMEDLVPTHFLSKEPLHTNHMYVYIYVLFNPLCDILDFDDVFNLFPSVIRTANSISLRHLSGINSDSDPRRVQSKQRSSNML